jgi:hypothetical protein
LEAAHRLSPPDHRRIGIARGPHLAGALRQFGECHVPQGRNGRSGCYAAVRSVRLRPSSGRHDEPAKPAPQWIVDLALEFNGEWHDKQVVAGNTVYLAPGLRVGYGNVSGFASVGVPIVNHMNGLQSKPDYRVVTGVAATF